MESKKRIVAMIPARMGSSRFPGKPLVKILDLPMIEHVRRRALLSCVDDVYVATCDEEIFTTVVQYGGKSIMTAKTHERCTDRVEEAVQNLQADIIVILQGDEPLFMPEVINLLIEPMSENQKIFCTNLLSPILHERDIIDEDIVKAVIDCKQYLMYYSRAPIPYRRVKDASTFYRQTGISAFTKEFLQTYSHLPPTQKEVIESIDFLRILDHRYPIFGVIYNQRTVGVDREDDIKIVEEILQEDPLQNMLYKKILEI